MNVERKKGFKEKDKGEKKSKKFLVMMNNNNKMR
jgi:hypothetical protein